MLARLVLELYYSFSCICVAPWTWLLCVYVCVRRHHSGDSTHHH
jgi:hypothetical protein